MKILVAGNPNYGLAAAIKTIFPDAVFASRTSGNWDLTIRENRKNFAKLSLEYDVVLSVSCLWHFYQTELVQEVALAWSKIQKVGRIIAIGSSADTPVKPTSWDYPASKKALRAYCRQLSQMAINETGPGFRVTYLSPGNLHTPLQDSKLPDTPKLDCDYVAGIIQWILSQPMGVNISEICLDAVEAK